MVKIKLVLTYFLITIFPNIILAGENNSVNNKFGIEFGFEHNILIWPKTVGILTPGAGAVDRNDLYITSCVRLNYTIGLTNKYNIMPFIGYNNLGGKLDNAYYSIKVIECGLFTQYKFLNFSFGLGTKIIHSLNVKYHNPEFDEDRTDWFNRQWKDVGMRISYLMNRFSISIEPWFGLTNLATGPIKGAKIYENHYRFMFCYKF